MLRTSKYGSVKITGTDLIVADGEVIEILEDAVFATINEAGITAPITSHNVSGVQAAGERIFAHTKFTGVQLASGSVRIGGFRRRKKVGLSSLIKNTFALWLYGAPFHDQYVTDKHGQQDRELLSGEIFPGRGYEGDQTNYITLGSDILFADDTAWAVSCFVEWDVIAQDDATFGNKFTSTNYTRFYKNVDGTLYGFSNEANDNVAWVTTIPTVRHHILIQCDGSDSDNLELFIDGISKGTRTMADSEIVIAEFMSAGSGLLLLDGTIEDFRVYERLLDSTEIAALQTKEALGGELLWYPCEDVDLLTAFDASGNENHGAKVSWDSANHVEGAWQNLMNKYGYNKPGIGPDVAINGTFDTDSDWTKGTGVTISGGVSNWASAAAGAFGLRQDAILSIGKKFKVQFTISDYSSGVIQLRLGTQYGALTYTANGAYEEIITCVGNTALYFYNFTNPGTMKIDNVSAEEYYADEVPADMSTATPPAYANPSLDCLGNDLVYAGQADYHGISVDAACFEGDAIGYFNFDSDIVLTETSVQTVRFRHYTDATVAVWRILISNSSSSLGRIFFKPAGVLYVKDDANQTIFQSLTLSLADGWHTFEINYNAGQITVAIDDVDYPNQVTEPGTFTSTFERFGGIGADMLTSPEKLCDIQIGSLGQYPICEGAGLTAYDVSGNGNHATGVSVDETNWGTQDDFHYIRDYGMSRKFMAPDKGKFDVDVESWVPYGGNTVEHDNGSLKCTYVDNPSGMINYLKATADLSSDLIVGQTYKVKIKAKVNSGSVDLRKSPGNILIGIVNTTDYVWYETTFVATSTTGDYIKFLNFDAGEILWIDEWSIELVDGVIPALADKSADALGNVIEYPQNSANAIPETYFHLPENIAELMAADLEERYMDIMDTGKGVFTPITDNSVTNGTFDADTDWTKEAGWTITEGKAVATASIFTIYQAGLTIGKIYKITFTISDYVAGTVKSRAGNTSGAEYSANGTYTDTLICTTNGNIYIDGVSAFTGKIDNVSAIEQNVESWITYSSNIIENDNGALKATYVDYVDGGYVYLRETKDLNTDLVVGADYKFVAKVKVNTGSVRLLIDGPGVWKDITSTEWTWIEIDFVPISTIDTFVLIQNMEAGEIFWIDEYHVSKTVNSTGNNMITDGEGFKWRDDDSDGVGNGWTQFTGTGTPTIVTGNGFVGNAQSAPHVNGVNSNFRYNTGINAINGQTYQVTGKFRAETTGWRIYLRSTSDSFSSDIGVNTGDAISFSYTVDATATAEIILNFYKGSAEANSYLEIDEIEVRPVIPSFFYEPLVLGSDPVVIKTDDLPGYRYLTQYYNETNRKDLILLAAGHSLDGGDHNKLLKFTKNN